VTLSQDRTIEWGAREWISLVGVCVVVVGAITAFAAASQAEDAKTSQRINALEARVSDLKQDLYEIKADVKELVRRR
jgi:hypothetical protein